jgi:N-acetylglucosamine kinase-like BadF-type ATPase
LWYRQDENFLSEVFKGYFKNAEITVHEDTYAAVYATTPKNEEAIVCILGTGSNCSFFDGKVLHQKVQSLGYIAMDDGSGNRFGRHLLRGYYFNKMPKELALEFEAEFNLDADYIKANLYKEPNPNAYLATLLSLLLNTKKMIFVKKLFLKNSRNLPKIISMQYDNCRRSSCSFCGFNCILP